MYACTMDYLVFCIDGHLRYYDYKLLQITLKITPVSTYSLFYTNNFLLVGLMCQKETIAK